MQLQTFSDQFTSIADFPIVATHEDYENVAVNEMIPHPNPKDDQESVENSLVWDYYTQDGGN